MAAGNLFANVVIGVDTFQTWVTRTNQLVNHTNKMANTTGVANIYVVNAHMSSANTLKLAVHGNAVFNNTVTFQSVGNIKIESGGMNGVYSNGTVLKLKNSTTGEIEFGNSSVSFSDLTGTIENDDFPATLAPTTGTLTYTANTTFNAANTKIQGVSLLVTANTVISGSTTINGDMAINSANTTVANDWLFNGPVTFSGANTVYNQNVLFGGAVVLSGSTTFNSNTVHNSTSQQKLGAPVLTDTSNAYSLAIADAGKYIRLGYTGATAVGITIPANATTSIPIGSEYMFIRTGSNTATLFLDAGGVTLNSDGGRSRMLYQWRTAVVKKVGTNEWDLIGNLSI